MAQDIYYDKGPCLSYKCFFNLIVGNRGGGKTYGYKTWSIDDYLKTDKRQFVWVRRYAEEIKKMKKSFFKDIASRYPNHQCSIHGDEKFGEFIIDKKVIGYYAALSTSAILKSTSFPYVDKIIFDEFLIIGKTYHYLNDEVVLLMELIDTIFRNREFSDDPDIVKPRGVYLLGNNVTVANPYFLYFGVKKLHGRFTIDRQKDLLVEMYTNEKFIEQKKQSHLGKLTAGTTYAEYSIENKAYLDNDAFIGDKPSQAKFYCAIDYKNHTYGFWMDYHNGLLYVNYEYDPYSYNHYALTRDDHTINTFLIKSLNNTYIKNLVWQFRNGNMYFKDQQVKNQVYEILSYFVN